MKSKFFGYKNKISFGLVLIIVMLFCLTATVTLALFFTSDWASSKVTMSGKVHIEAVGNGVPYESIEDTNTSNLQVTIGDGYDRLIPGGSININANCKVYKSTTKPHLRADINMFLYDKETGEPIGSEYSDEHAFMPELYSSIYYQLTGNNWYLHTDGYFYYIGNIAQTGTGGDTKLAEVDATLSDTVVPFITSPVKFPTSVTEDYSGYKVSFKIKFQAIQNYIPDDNGARVTSTITNSLKIFDHFKVNAPTEYTDHAYFNITKNSDGAWEINPKSRELSEYVVLPSVTPDGEPITTIGDGFKGAVGVKHLIVPSSYTTIEKNAFESCASMISVDMSKSSITTITEKAFYNVTNLVDIQLPNCLIRIEKEAFLWCSNLPRICFPESLEYIGQNAFGSTQIKSISITKNINQIVNGVAGSSVLTYIEVDGDNPYYDTIDNKILVDSRTMTLVQAVSTSPLTNGKFYVPEGILALGNDSLTYVPCESVYISSTVTTIGVGLFPSTMKHLEVDSANSNFSTDGYVLYNKNMTIGVIVLTVPADGNYTIPDSVTRISDWNNLDFNEITIGASYDYSYFLQDIKAGYINVKSNNNNFKSDNGRAVLSKDGKTFIKYAILNGNTTYDLPDTVETLSNKAFNNCQTIQKVILHEGIEVIASAAFTHCTSLTNICTGTLNNTLPSTLSGGGEYTYVYSGTPLQSLKIYGDIGGNCFRNCKQLSSVTFADSCSEIGVNVFYNTSSNLVKIEFEGVTPPKLLDDLFKPIATNNFKIYVPDAALVTYRSATYFKNYADRIYPASQKPST